MSPDLEWHVDDVGGEETIVSRQPPRHPRRWGMLGLIIALGVGLGVIYSSLPAPPRIQPTPTPPPTATPSAIPLSLYQTIEQEADALARGNRAAFRQLLDFRSFDQQRQLLDRFKPWGRPTDQPLFTLIDVGLLADDHAWADVSQYRDGNRFRQTRFYRLREGQWRRTDFDTAFWSGRAETVDTPHFRVVYAREDRELIAPIAAQLEDVVEQVCLTLDCSTGPEVCTDALERRWCSVFPRFVSLTLDLRGLEFEFQNFQDAAMVLIMPSPRVTGVYEQNAPYRYNDDSGTAVGLAWILTWRVAYGTVTVANAMPDGEPLVWAMALRVLHELQQRHSDPDLIDPFEFNPHSVEDAVELEAVWQDLGQADNQVRLYTAHLLLNFVTEAFGDKTTAKLVKSVRTATSLAEAIELGTAEDLEDFREQWQAWLKRQAEAGGS